MHMGSEDSDTWCVLLVLHRQASMTEPIRRPCSVAVVFHLQVHAGSLLPAMRLAPPDIHSPIEDLANTVEGAL